MYDLIIKNASIVSSSDIVTRDLAILNGQIHTIADSINESAKEVFDAKNLLVLPGMIDSQVHFREPGLIHKETIETGSKSAVLGGITTFLEMPNTNPSTTTVERIQEKVEIGKKTSYTNFGFFMGANGNNLDELKKIPDLEGCCGVKIFLGSSTGDLLLYDEDKLFEIFSNIKSPIALHSENERLLVERKEIKEKATTAHAHPEWRDVNTALTATTKLIEIAKKAKKSVHVLHISTKDEMEFLKDNKDTCTVEVLPQHLTLHAPECYDKLGTYAQMNPPIRTKDHLEGIWKALDSGVVDMIGSDHAPHTKEEKDKGYPNSPSGMPGVQTILPVMLNYVNQGKLTIHDLVNYMCVNPTKLYSLEGKGLLEVGKDADITIVDMNKKHTFTNEEIASKVGWTPYAGMEVQGMPVMTIVNGNIVMKDGKITDDLNKGKPIRTS